MNEESLCAHFRQGKRFPSKLLSIIGVSVYLHCCWVTVLASAVLKFHVGGIVSHHSDCIELCYFGISHYFLSTGKHPLPLPPSEKGREGGREGGREERKAGREGREGPAERAHPVSPHARAAEGITWCSLGPAAYEPYALTRSPADSSGHPQDCESIVQYFGGNLRLCLWPHSCHCCTFITKWVSGRWVGLHWRAARKP